MYTFASPLRPTLERRIPASDCYNCTLEPIHILLITTAPEWGASLGGPIMGHIGWGGPSTSPTLPFIVVVSPCRCEPLRGPAAVVGRGC